MTRDCLEPQQVVTKEQTSTLLLKVLVIWQSCLAYCLIVSDLWCMFRLFDSQRQLAVYLFWPDKRFAIHFLALQETVMHIRTRS